MKRDATVYDHQAQGWADPPGFIHFPSFGAEPGNWEFVDGFLRRAVESCAVVGDTKIGAELVDALRYRDELIEEFREAGEKWSNVSSEETEAAEGRASGPFHNATMERWNRTPIRAWAHRSLWGGACDDLDTWVHRWYAVAARIAAASTVTSFFQLYGVLPKPPASATVPLHSDQDLERSPLAEIAPPDADGFSDGGRGPRRFGKGLIRSNYELVAAMAGLRKEGLWPKAPTASSVGTAIMKRFHKVGQRDGWTRRVIMERGSDALKSILPGYADHVGKWDKVGAMLDRHEHQNGPFRRMRAQSASENSSS